MFFLITFLLKWPPQLGILTWHSRRELEAEGGDLKGITDPSFFLSTGWIFQNFWNASRVQNINKNVS